MRARHFLVSSVFCSSLLALSWGVSADAIAAGVVQPQGNWAVSKAEARSGSVPYCALARRFMNGSIITFARNINDETSLAVDFPRGTFSNGEAAMMSFDAGAGEVRSYEVKPVSERSAIIRMGKDEKFYSALQQSGKLEIRVSDQLFSYAMPDMGVGIQDLSACLGQAVEPAAGEPVAEAIPPAPEKVQAKPEPKAEKAKALKTNDEKAKAPKLEERQVNMGMREAAPIMARAAAPQGETSVASAGSDPDQELREENTRLRNALERERRSYENSFQQSGENTSASAELAEKVRLLEIENSELRLKSEGKAGSGASHADAETRIPDPKLMEVIGQLRRENEDLKASLEAVRKQAAEAGASTKAQPDQSVVVKNMQAKVTALENENQSLKLSIAEKREEKIQQMNISSVRKIKETEMLLASAVAERDRLQTEISKIKTADSDGRVKIASDNWNLEQATVRFNEAEREIRRLGSAVEQERAKCEVEKKDLEYMLFDPKIASREQIGRMKAMEDELFETKKQLENAGAGKEKVSALEAKNKELELRIADLTGKNAGYEGQMKAQQAEAQKVAGYESKIREMEDKLAMAQGVSERASAQEARIKDLEQKLTLASTEAEKARELQKNAISMSEQASVIDALKQEIASLNGQVANLQSEKSLIEMRMSQVSPAAGTPLQIASTSQVSRNSIARSETTVEHVRPADIQVSALSAEPLAPQQVVKPMPGLEAGPVTSQVIENAPTPTITAATANLKLMAPGEIENLLRKASIKTDSGVQKLASSTGAGRVAYRWQTNGLFGTAEQKGMETAAQFDGMVNEYLAKTRTRCTGQFASVPALQEVSGNKRLTAYEIACVDGSGQGASAALIFYSADGKTFTTIAHEAVPESMDVAMDARDKIIGILQ